jgi:urease accessory protein
MQRIFCARFKEVAMSFTSKLGRMIAPAILLASLALPALAHPAHPGGETHDAGFAQGFAHPFGGFDHLLAMIAVGLWAVQFATRSGNRAGLWLLPAAFVLPMGAGFLLALNGIVLPGVEAGIALSVLILGLAVAFAARPPLAAAMAITAGFALFHGYAHGTEMGAGVATAYAAGMLLATALLHGIGLVVALLSQQVATPVLTRAAGAAVAVAGAVILVA